MKLTIKDHFIVEEFIKVNFLGHVTFTLIHLIFVLFYEEYALQYE